MSAFSIDLCLTKLKELYLSLIKISILLDYIGALINLDSLDLSQTNSECFHIQLVLLKCRVS